MRNLSQLLELDSPKVSAIWIWICWEKNQKSKIKCWFSACFEFYQLAPSLISWKPEKLTSFYRVSQQIVLLGYYHFYWNTLYIMVMCWSLANDNLMNMLRSDSLMGYLSFFRKKVKFSAALPTFSCILHKMLL